MKSVSKWSDLQAFGIQLLTGESCGLSYRLLCDVTDAGQHIIEKCFDVKVELAEPWNRGAIGSIMLPHEMLIPLGIFALLEAGCSEVWRKNGLLIGLEPDDSAHRAAVLSGDGFRRYAYQGTAGSRNRHEATGRIT